MKSELKEKINQFINKIIAFLILIVIIYIIVFMQSLFIEIKNQKVKLESVIEKLYAWEIKTVKYQTELMQVEDMLLDIKKGVK
jgi:hypothetical protein